MIRLNHFFKTLSLSLLMALISLPMAAQRVSVKTNALYWAGATPNLGLALRVNRHMTVDIEGIVNKFKFKSVNTRALAVTPELRYWYSARPHAGHFIGLMGLASDYRVSYDGTTHEGNAFGFGPTYGYSWVLGRRWSMEASVGAGVLRVREQKYATDNGSIGHPNNRRWLFAPLKVGLSFVYVIR